MADNEQPDAGYNPIFEKLVKHREDVLGLVAYGIYKIAKREWVAQFGQDRQRNPNEAELTAYISTWTPSQLDNVQGTAEKVLASYAEEVIAAAEPGII